jgi:hypothetical protein
MVSKLQRALIAYKVAGTQARKLKTTEAIGLTTGRKRIVLQDVYGGLTAAGKYWTEELKQTIPPFGFASQVPRREGNTETVKMRNGKSAITRRFTADGEFEFTAAGTRFYKSQGPP